MKKLIFSVMCIVTICFFANAQSTVSFSEANHIDELMNAYKAFNRKNDIQDGYRLQIAFTNSRDEAYAAKAKLLKAFPNERCYVDYEQPYYKLKLGDYENKLQVAEAMKNVISVYSGAFIVKDKIRCKK